LLEFFMIFRIYSISAELLSFTNRIAMFDPALETTKAEVGGKEMTLKRTGFIQVVATLMVVVLLSWTPSMAAPGAAAVGGTVLVGVDKQPLAGATIHLSDAMDGRLVSSMKTGSDGSFQIENVTSATYEVAVEYDGGLYLVGSPVRVQDGKPLTLNLAIEKSTAAAAPLGRSRRGAGGLFSSPLAASLLVAGSAITMGAVIESTTTDDNDPIASESLTR
jgi:hypothetical protein